MISTPTPPGGVQPQAAEYSVCTMQEFETKAIGLVGMLYCPVGTFGILIPLGSGLPSIHDVTVTVAAAEGL